jgi:hypothetical protein
MVGFEDCLVNGLFQDENPLRLGVLKGCLVNLGTSEKERGE